MAITKKSFGQLPDGKPCTLFEITNKNGMKVCISDIGCAIVSLYVPDKTGGHRDVVFGFNDGALYAVNKAFFGVAVGRVANRINSGKFSLDGKEYTLVKNDNGLHHLHGGIVGFDKKVWVTAACDELNNVLSFTHVSPDGDEGYPGDLTVGVTYKLDDENTLCIEYTAETSTKTIANLTNHSYFNLEGHDAKDIYAHKMQIYADKITTVDKDLMPTGEFMEVKGTPYDFTNPKPIGQDIEAAGGYDNNFVLNKEGIAAKAYAPESGIAMEVYTNSPGIQLYTGNFLDGTIQGKGGNYHHKQSGFCLETQLFPDAINQPHFPSSVVEKGSPQKFYTSFKFTVE